MSLDGAPPTGLIDPAPAAILGYGRAATLARLGGWAIRSGLAVFDQGCISGGNILLYFFLARSLSPQEYGVFATVFAVYMLLLGVHTGLIQDPMSVLGNAVYGDDLVGYCPRVLRFHVLLTLSLAAPTTVVGAWFLWGSQDLLARPLGEALLALGISLPFLLLLWLSRRMAYLYLAPQQAALNAVMYIGLLLSGMAALRATKHVSVATAFIVMALVSGAAGTVLLARLGALRRSSGGTADVIRHHIHFGKWLVALALFSWLARDAYYLLAAGLIGSAEAGALRAVGNLVSPLEQTQTALGLLLMPWFSSLCFRGLRERLRRRVLQFTIAMTALSLGYLVVLWLVAPRVLQLVYKDKYDAFAWMIPWLALLQVMRAVSIGALLYLMVNQKTRLIFYASMGAGTVTVLGALLVRWGALRGLVYSMELSFLVAAVLTVVFFQKSVASECAPPETGRA